MINLVDNIIINPFRFFSRLETSFEILSSLFCLCSPNLSRSALFFPLASTRVHSPRAISLSPSPSLSRLSAAPREIRLGRRPESFDRAKIDPEVLFVNCISPRHRYAAPPCSDKREKIEAVSRVPDRDNRLQSHRSGTRFSRRTLASSNVLFDNQRGGHFYEKKKIRKEIFYFILVYNFIDIIDARQIRIAMI